MCSLIRVGEQAADENTIRVHSFLDPSAVKWHCNCCFKIRLWKLFRQPLTTDTPATEVSFLVKILICEIVNRILLNLNLRRTRDS